MRSSSRSSNFRFNTRGRPPGEEDNGSNAGSSDGLRDKVLPHSEDAMLECPTVSRSDNASGSRELAARCRDMLRFVPQQLLTTTLDIGQFDAMYDWQETFVMVDRT